MMVTCEIKKKNCILISRKLWYQSFDGIKTMISKFSITFWTVLLYWTEIPWQWYSFWRRTSAASGDVTHLVETHTKKQARLITKHLGSEDVERKTSRKPLLKCAFTHLDINSNLIWKKKKENSVLQFIS